ncbi:RNA-binding protein [Paenibacillus thermoaerophilus]|uniref:RNA-binding protein n=1 Tax=Paenibacillus thermoaerophilus TaxID=1215385 RepID=A0ABW2V1J7_9BACL|nr:YlmH/Sll1252 family protein [Paenibacillus thermoaerophilus]TMV19093.1 RNA-binding protein [Paenibacillus thermoaerophilus]
MSSELHAHFHPDERPFVDKALEWIQRSARQHDVKRTDFLDPRQAWILESLVNREADVQLLLFGGYKQAERRRALIAPDYLMPEPEECGVALIEATSPDGKFAELDHGDFLGALTALGVKRDKLGDIHLHEDACHILVAEELADYFSLNLRQVHRVHVFTQRLPLERLRPAETQFQEMKLSVASMRLDGILSDVCRMSRAKVLPPIKAGRCKVNWKVEEDPGKPLRQGDVVSLQGFGRFKILELEGESKSGRIRLRVGKYS